MATTTIFVPIEVYLHTSNRPDVDDFDGVIEEGNLGQNDPSAWQAAICSWFQSQAVSGGCACAP